MFHVYEDEIVGACDLDICRWLKSPVPVMSSSIWAESLVFIKLFLLIQNLAEKACLLYVVEFSVLVLLLLEGSQD
jgi:hypothetical protein